MRKGNRGFSLGTPTSNLGAVRISGRREMDWGLRPSCEQRRGRLGSPPRAGVFDNCELEWRTEREWGSCEWPRDGRALGSLRTERGMGSFILCQ
ncbi:hypothetical protein KFK09_004750 [Dendrobium nobile]|uniref:Uncharacterized protein n=1 Tax=Dendrobium nobile TaxID=94219 RepID=A0A8T3BWF1_DENNO|nr:hypothetical protein KFK09_004750 [Dendrobium nobile]